MTSDRKRDLRFALVSAAGAEEGADTTDRSVTDAGGTELDAQKLRALSEGISREFPFQLEYTALVLYDRDPEHLQAQWHLVPDDLARARGAFPDDQEEPRQILRLCRLDQDGRAEVVASAPQDSGGSTGQEVFSVHGDSAEYECELGLESNDGGWLLLVRSNRIVPAGWPASSPRGGRSETGAGQAQDPERASNGAKSPWKGQVEPALAAVGEPLYPVFPNLEQVDSPAAGDFSSVAEARSRVQALDGDTDYPSAAAEQHPFQRGDEPRTALDAALAAMPPPLLPSMPDGQRPAELLDALYDPRAALSSAVLLRVGPPGSDIQLQAELVVQGRARPGSTFDLFGHSVRVGADGIFCVRRAIDEPRLLSLALERSQSPEPIPDQELPEQA